MIGAHRCVSYGSRGPQLGLLNSALAVPAAELDAPSQSQTELIWKFGVRFSNFAIQRWKLASSPWNFDLTLSNFAIWPWETRGLLSNFATCGWELGCVSQQLCYRTLRRWLAAGQRCYLAKQGFNAAYRFTLNRRQIPVGAHSCTAPTGGNYMPCCLRLRRRASTPAAASPPNATVTPGSGTSTAGAGALTE